jgi:spore coat polysaccharide biosynthesis protein SpsF (cytidylyltransferase family)
VHGTSASSRRDSGENQPAKWQEYFRGQAKLRKLLAALACRVESRRLYAKPLQRLGGDVTILAQILDSLASVPEIQGSVLCVSSLAGNEPFTRIASEHGAGYILGDPEDVLGRLIQGAEVAAATDVFVATSENPFLGFEFIEDAWRRHLSHENDVTVLDDVPDGMGFEIYRMEALQKSHLNGTPDQREHAARYIKQNLVDFCIEVLEPDSSHARPDIRFSVDYLEDLVFCRAAYQGLREKSPLIPMIELIEFADSNPALCNLVAPHCSRGLPWRLEKLKE